jgi:hypothetical protein
VRPVLAILTVLLAAVAFGGSAQGEERVDVCAVYSDTGRTYHVNAIFATGSDLNQTTHTFNYNVLGRYIVIFWAQNQASVIQMNALFGGPSYISSIGFDQEGRSWQISAYSPLVCPL